MTTGRSTSRSIIRQNSSAVPSIEMPRMALRLTAFGVVNRGPGAQVVGYFFDRARLRRAGAAHGVVFRPSILAFSVSMVSMNGSLVNADGTPSQ